MTPLKPITNPMANMFTGSDHWSAPFYSASQGRWKRYKTGGHFVEDTSYQRHEIPLGALAKLNPRIVE